MGKGGLLSELSTDISSLWCLRRAGDRSHLFFFDGLIALAIHSVKGLRWPPIQNQRDSGEERQKIKKNKQHKKHKHNVCLILMLVGRNIIGQVHLD